MGVTCKVVMNSVNPYTFEITGLMPVALAFAKKIVTVYPQKRTSKAAYFALLLS